MRAVRTTKAMFGPALYVLKTRDSHCTPMTFYTQQIVVSEFRFIIHVGSVTVFIYLYCSFHSLSVFLSMHSDSLSIYTVLSVIYVNMVGTVWRETRNAMPMKWIYSKL